MKAEFSLPGYRLMRVCQASSQRIFTTLIRDRRPISTEAVDLIQFFGFGFGDHPESAWPVTSRERRRVGHVRKSQVRAYAGRVSDFTRVSFPKARNDARYGRFKSDVVLEFAHFDGLPGQCQQTKQLAGHYSLGSRFSALEKIETKRCTRCFGLWDPQPLPALRVASREMN